MNKTDYLDIKEWAKEEDKKHRDTILYYIKEGISVKNAVDMVLETSTLGAGYKAQIKHDFNYPIFGNLINK